MRAFALPGMERDHSSGAPGDYSSREELPDAREAHNRLDQPREIRGRDNLFDLAAARRLASSLLTLLLARLCP
jgi:hypothetical protein